MSVFTHLAGLLLPVVMVICTVFLVVTSKGNFTYEFIYGYMEVCRNFCGLRMLDLLLMRLYKTKHIDALIISCLFSNLFFYCPAKLLVFLGPMYFLMQGLALAYCIIKTSKNRDISMIDKVHIKVFTAIEIGIESSQQFIIWAVVGGLLDYIPWVVIELPLRISFLASTAIGVAGLIFINIIQTRGDAAQKNLILLGMMSMNLSVWVLSKYGKECLTSGNRKIEVITSLLFLFIINIAFEWVTLERSWNNREQVFRNILQERGANELDFLVEEINPQEGQELGLKYGYLEDTVFVEKKRDQQDHNPGISEGKCFICFVNPPECRIIPCGHGGTCKECTLRVFSRNMRCPVCRVAIDSVEQYRNQEDGRIRVIERVSLRYKGLLD